ncbi:MAG: hypothetical protein QXT64_02870 [Desulfurococcaceae archaeon]
MKLLNHRIGSYYILDGAVTTPKIADNAVTSVKILDGEIVSADLKRAFGAEITVSVAAGGVSTIPKGIYLVKLGANTKVQYTPDGGTTWRDIIAAGGGGTVISDGSTVRLNNGGTAAEDSYLYPLA